MRTYKGTYNYSIDKKGRLNIPPRFRGAPDSPDGELYVITPGFEGCLYLYTHQSWQKVEEKLLALPTMAKPKARTLARMILWNSVDTRIDKQGRIMIPQHLLDLAGIKKEVVIAGLGEKIELWAPDVMRKYKESLEVSYEDAAREFLT